MEKTQVTQEISLEVFPRKDTGKSAAYRNRKSGFIPGVIYGADLSRQGKGISISLDPKNFRKVYKAKGKTSIISVTPKDGAPNELAGQKFLFEEIQTHSLRNEVIHVDLHQLDLKKPIRVVVPLHFVGKAKGLAEGGIVSILNRQVEIKTLPEKTPSHIDVDVSDLGLNESLKIDEVAKRVGEKDFEFIFDSSYAVVAVLAPEEEVVAAPVVAADAAAGAEGAKPGDAAGAADSKEGSKA